MRTRLLALTLIPLAVVACSSGGSAASSRSTTTLGSTSTTSAVPLRVAPTGKTAADNDFCRMYSSMQDEGAAVSPNPKDPTLIRDHYGRVATLADDMAAKENGALHDAAVVVARLARESTTSGSLAPFGRPEGKKAVETLGAHATGHCRAR